jgi:branched-subunit amino acid aminotransferase/4-amino-4-deoxychorismate lyase
MIIYIDGKFKKSSKEELRQLTPGIVEGKGVFETMRVVKGSISDKEEHLKRLHRGLKRFGISRRVTSIFLQEVSDNLLKRNKLSHARLRLSVTKHGGKIHVVLVMQKIGALKTSYALYVSPVCRPLNSFTHLKSIRYELFRNALLEAQSKGFDEALLLNHRGHVVETATANIFWVKGKVLYTPSQACGCLNGITKGRALSLARQLGLKIRKGKFSLKHLLGADAVFLSNAVMGIKPVSRLLFKRFKISKLLIVQN